MDTLNLAGAVILSGLVIVFLVLITLIGVVAAVGKLSGTTVPKASSKPPVPAQSSGRAAALSKSPVVEPGISGETVAVIAAAVAAAMEEDAPGVSYAVTGIQRARTARPVWGFAGMQQNTRPF